MPAAISGPSASALAIDIFSPVENAGHKKEPKLSISAGVASGQLNVNAILNNSSVHSGIALGGTPVPASRSSSADASDLSSLAAEMPATLDGTGNRASVQERVPATTADGPVPTGATTAARSSHRPTEGGTDITPTEPASENLEMLGDEMTIKIGNFVREALQNSANAASFLGAKLSGIAVTQATREGEAQVAAAKQHMNGAIAAGVMNMATVAITTGVKTRDKVNEFRSLRQNAHTATELEKTVEMHKNTVKVATHQLHEGSTPMDEGMAGVLERSSIDTRHQAELLRLEHDKVMTRAHMSSANADAVAGLTKPINEAMDTAFGVSAAEDRRRQPS